ncbi:p45 [Ectropis obliqua nucleopolyhedrovirus]|uniref:p45 n=1 Tax=Ectropis obliqua nucleopolyhedrovirus TaxID=59376 RepID=A0EYY5_9ABAC|nr:p45 [Ectropis obliqua nucleopolyhedrovirus]ABI35764.1 p45 [Ectropis obliqua nucleopolyhedrovirus]AGS47933.1 p48 protein [Ectropis obliqua nucleopolyhedrovirus]QWV59649.1 p45 [Ectropis obliqua nucleopolyhedrovirus]UYO72880.1 p45 [Ectropis obliqua nucleopolyhedrovirus]
MNVSATNLVKYSLQFRKNENDIKNVNFSVQLTKCEIDSLTFLFSKYYDQSKYVIVKGLTFFNEFNKCVDAVKHNFDSKQDNNEIKQLFSMFLKHEFMGQIPNFKKIMQFLQKYLLTIDSPSISDINSTCNVCPVNQLACLNCKILYLSASISMFDINTQNGWDIFLRPMFGLPLFIYILMKTDYDNNGIFNSDDLMTNAFATFFYNLLSDKSVKYINVKTVQGLVDECRRVTASFDVQQLEFLLCMLRNKNTCDTPLFLPFKNFIIQLACKTKIKQAKINKIASVVFTGFYLRIYIEAATPRLINNQNGNNSALRKQYPFGGPGKTLTPYEMELRNVCRFLLPTYTNEQFENFINKLYGIKQDLSIDQYIVTEKLIRQLVSKHNLDEDFAVLLNHNV